MKKDKRREKDDWTTSLNKTIIGFFMNATAEDIRDLLKKSNYEQYTGINPDTIEIRELTADEIQAMREEYELL